jgi:hypothetical protein
MLAADFDGKNVLYGKTIMISILYVNANVCGVYANHPEW